MLILDNTLRLRAIAEKEKRQRIGKSFQSFVEHVRPQFQWHWHCIALAKVLDDVVEGRKKRVIIVEPPRHGKSEEVSRLFPAYILYKRPQWTVGLSSYSAELAYGMSRNARMNYQRSGMKLSETTTAVKEWQTALEGMMWTSGVGGSITGKGYNVGLIDDPLKNAEEAYSYTIREKQIDWWDSTWTTRAEPGAAQIIVMTRWHAADLVGKLLDREVESPENWHIVHFPAIKEKEPPQFPKSCTIEPDPRKPGEALCPERYPLDVLEARRRTMPARFFLPIFQGRPTAVEGDIWKESWFTSNTFNPEELKNGSVYDIGNDWDLAYTEDDRNSASARVKSGRDAKGNVYIFAVEWRWVEFPDLVTWMKTLREPAFVEAKASGKSAVQVLKRESLPAKEVTIFGGDKIARARLASVVAEQGKVFLAQGLEEKLLHDMKQGLLHFPNGLNDDVNDAFVQAINRHTRGGGYRFGIIGEKKENGNQRSESEHPVAVPQNGKNRNTKG